MPVRFRLGELRRLGGSELLNDLRGDRERTPPDAEAALAQIRKLLAGERPAA